METTITARRGRRAGERFEVTTPGGLDAYEVLAIH